MKNFFRPNKLATTLFVLALAALVACRAAEDAPPATAPPLPTDTPAPTLNPAPPDLIRGQQVWLDKQCVLCHGQVGQGGMGPTLTGLSMPFDQFLHIQRTALPPKPAFNTAELPEQDAYNVYAWLQSLDSQTVSAQPIAAPELAEGEELGMTLWAQYECDQCHGAFAQGSAKGPTLAELSYPYEMERATMRQTAAEIPQHQAEHIRDVVWNRLYKWLQAGADPLDGC